MSIAENIAEISKRIAAAAARAGRSTSDITLLAVSKAVASEQVQEAVSAGQRVFGENYVQSARETFRAVRPPPGGLELHLIGALQRNKAKQAVELFDMIETVDRPALARELAKHAERCGKLQRVLVQVHISGEESKSGCPPEQLEALCRTVLSLPALRLEGLMSIGTWHPPEAPADVRRSELRRMRQLRDELSRTLGAPLPHLSMGMSSDFEEAVEEGASIVRVGTGIFGERDYG